MPMIWFYIKSWIISPYILHNNEDIKPRTRKIYVIVEVTATLCFHGSGNNRFKINKNKGKSVDRLI